MIIYRLAQLIVPFTGRVLRTVEVRGLENVPESGPCILVANHQSILDPVLIQSYCRRPLYTMAKSTQFTGPFFSRVMPRILAFPVRRYQVDPQSVRIALRRLSEAHAVGVYIEGERSWDGRLQAPRLGTIRLMLRAGVPIVPCAIAGSYDVWPRWDRALRRAPVRILFGEPFRLPHLLGKAERERALPAACERVLGELRRLLAEAGLSDELRAVDAAPAAR